MAVMRRYKEFINSGILELYVLGYTSAEENREVEKMALLHPALWEEVLAIQLALEKYAAANAVIPDPILRPLLMSTIDLTERLLAGEVLDDVPLLSESSKIADYEQWINRADMAPDDKDFEGVFAKIIGHTPQLLSALIWIKDMAPEETHNNEFERFLIIEGTCDIAVEDELFSLKSGDYFQVPLHKNHAVRVTSDIPCKALLQRLAA